MKSLTIILLLASSPAIAQNAFNGLDAKPGESSAMDTIFGRSEPAGGYDSLQYRIERKLSGADTVGRKRRLRLDNIAFIVGANGRVDSAWVIYHRRPIHLEIIKIVKATEWKPFKEDGVPVAVRQELYIDIYVTRRVLKKHGYWPSFAERLLAPWLN